MRRAREVWSWSTDPRRLGIALCIVGAALLWVRSLLAGAIGIELIGAAFWCWARAADDAPEQVMRWSWVRRPATALWLAFAIHAAFPVLAHGHGPPLPARGVLQAMHGGATVAWVALFRVIEAGAVVWAGLELLAALPMARAFSDLPGPFLGTRIWLPALLPAAGFAVLWRQSEHWIDVPFVRLTAMVLLTVTAVLAVLRAYARRSWTASLRWLVVTDCALAALLVAGNRVTPLASLLLWFAACGTHVFLLVGELRGSAPRRGVQLTRLWRAASWTALASLAWPAMIAHGVRPSRVNALIVPGIAIATAIAAWLSVARMHSAEERRKVMRPDPALTSSHAAAIAVLMLGPLALAVAWWGGFEPPWRSSLLALAPAAVGGWLAVLARQTRTRAVWERLGTQGDAPRALAQRIFELVVHVERRVLAALRQVTGGVTGAIHDLHTGDAQEYLLFLVGLGVLAMVLPLLR